MPQAPRYTPQVEERALPQARFNANAPLESFGGGRAAAGVSEAIGGLAGVATEIYQKEKQQADDLATQTAYSDALKLSNDLKYNQEYGLITKKGSKAFGAAEELNVKLNEGLSKISDGLNNDSQRALFSKIKSHVSGEFNSDVGRHTSSELISFHKDQTSANIETLAQDAALNARTPGKVQNNLNLIRSTLTQYGNSVGWSPEETAIEVKKAENETHLGVINQYLFGKDDRGAKLYYDQIRGELTPEAVKKADASFRVYDTEIERQKKLVKEQLEIDQKKTQNGFLVKLHDNKLSAVDVLRSNLDPFGSGGKEQFIKLIASEGKRDDNSVATELFRRIHLPDGDPAKLTDENALNGYVIDNKISKTTLNWLRTEIQGGHTTEGKERSQLMKGLNSVARGQLVTGNPFLGIKDPIGETNLLRFNNFVTGELNKAKKEGKPIAPLLDPESKDWVGKYLKNYKRTPIEIIHDLVSTSPGGSPGIAPTIPQSAPTINVPVTSPAPPKTPEPNKARLPGEGAADYLKRMKGLK